MPAPLVSAVSRSLLLVSGPVSEAWCAPLSSCAPPAGRSADLALVDLLAARREDVPRRAEGLRALALDLAGLVVVVVVVQRVAAVGGLQLAVLALRRPALRRRDA